MSRGAMNFNEDKVEYYTPKKLFGYFFNTKYPCDYDPATTLERAVYHGIPNFDTIETDGLKADWTKHHNIWINPPFNLKKEFWRKAVETYRQTEADIYFLCPANFLPTKAFAELDQSVVIYIPEGRIKFETNPRGGGQAMSPAFGSVVVRPTHWPSMAYIPKEFL